MADKYRQEKNTGSPSKQGSPAMSTPPADNLSSSPGLTQSPKCVRSPLLASGFASISPTSPGLISPKNTARPARPATARDFCSPEPPGLISPSPSGGPRPATARELISPTTSGLVRRHRRFFSDIPAVPISLESISLSPIQIEMCKYCDACLEETSLVGPHSETCPRYDPAYHSQQAEGVLIHDMSFMFNRAATNSQKS